MQHSDQSSKTSNYTSISKRIPQISSLTNDSNIVINVPPINQLHDKKFWQWQIDKKYIYFDSSSCNEIQNRGNAVEMITVHISNWVPDLVNGNLIISGFNEEGRPKSLVVKKRISSLIFNTDDKYYNNCCLSGRISESGNLPEFVRKEFSEHRTKKNSSSQYGIPENWKELCVQWQNQILTGYPEDLAALKNKEQEYNRVVRQIPLSYSKRSTLIANNSYERLLEFNTIFGKHNISEEDRNRIYRSITSGNNCVTKSFFDVKLDKSVRDTFVQTDDETSSDVSSSEEDFIESDSPPSGLQTNKSISNGSDAELIKQLLLEFGDTPDDTLSCNTSLQQIINEENTILSDKLSNDTLDCNTILQQLLNEEHTILSDKFNSDDSSDYEIFPKTKKCSILLNKPSAVQETDTGNCNILNETTNHTLTSVLKELPVENNSLSENLKISSSKKYSILSDCTVDANNSLNRDQNSRELYLTDWIDEANFSPKKAKRKNSIPKNFVVHTNKKLCENILPKIISRNISPNKPQTDENNLSTEPTSFRKTSKKLFEKNPKKNCFRKTGFLQVIENIDENDSAISNKKPVKEIDLIVNENTVPKNGQNLNNPAKKRSPQIEENVDGNNLPKRAPSSRIKFTVDKFDENISPTKSKNLKNPPKKLSLQTDEKIDGSSLPRKSSSFRKSSTKVTVPADDNLDENISPKKIYNLKSRPKKLLFQADEKIDFSLQIDDNLLKVATPVKAPKKLPVQTNENISPKKNSRRADQIIDGNNSPIKATSTRKNTSKKLTANDQLNKNISPTKSGRKILLQIDDNCLTKAPTPKKTPKQLPIQTDKNISPKKLQTDENNSLKKSTSSKKTSKKLPAVQTDAKLDRRKNISLQIDEETNSVHLFKIPQTVSGKIHRLGQPPLLLFEDSCPVDVNDSSSYSISSRGRIRRQTSDFWIGFQSFRNSSSISFSQNILAHSTVLSNSQLTTPNNLSTINNDRESSINYSSAESISDCYNLNAGGDFNHLDKKSTRIKMKVHNRKVKNDNKVKNLTTPKHVQNKTTRDRSSRKRINVINEKYDDKQQSSSRNASIKFRNTEEENIIENKKMRKTSPKISKTSVELENSILTTRNRLGKEQNTNQQKIKKTSSKSSNENLLSVESANLTKKNNSENSAKEKNKPSFKRTLFSDRTKENSAKKKNEPSFKRTLFSDTDINLSSKETKKYPSRNSSFRINYNESLIPNINFISNTPAILSNESITKETKGKTVRLEDKNPKAIEKQNTAKKKKSAQKSIKLSAKPEEYIRNSDDKLNTRCFVLIPKTEQLLPRNTSNFLAGKLTKRQQINSKEESCFNVRKTIDKNKVKKRNKKKKTINFFKTAVELESFVKKYKKKSKKKPDLNQTPNNLQPSSSKSSTEKSQKRRQLYNEAKWQQSEKFDEMVKNNAEPKRKSFLEDDADEASVP